MGVLGYKVQGTRNLQATAHAGFETCSCFFFFFSSLKEPGFREGRDAVRDCLGDMSSAEHVQLGENWTKRRAGMIVSIARTMHRCPRSLMLGVVQRMANKGDVSGALFKWFTLAFLLEVKEPHDPDSLAAAARLQFRYLFLSLHFGIFIFVQTLIHFIYTQLICSKSRPNN